MATKTISIEIDVYEKLRSLKKDSRESFSQVLRRASWGEEQSTGASILKWIVDTRKDNKFFIQKDILDRLDLAQEIDFKPENKWNIK